MGNSAGKKRRGEAQLEGEYGFQAEIRTARTPQLQNSLERKYRFLLAAIGVVRVSLNEIEGESFAAVRAAETAGKPGKPNAATAKMPVDHESRFSVTDPGTGLSALALCVRHGNVALFMDLSAHAGVEVNHASVLLAFLEGYSTLLDTRVTVLQGTLTPPGAPGPGASTNAVLALQEGKALSARLEQGLNWTIITAPNPMGSNAQVTINTLWTNLNRMWRVWLSRSSDLQASGVPAGASGQRGVPMWADVIRAAADWDTAQRTIRAPTTPTPTAAVATPSATPTPLSPMRGYSVARQIWVKLLRDVMNHPEQDKRRTFAGCSPTAYAAFHRQIYMVQDLVTLVPERVNDRSQHPARSLPLVLLPFVLPVRSEGGTREGPPQLNHQDGKASATATSSSATTTTTTTATTDDDLPLLTPGADALQTFLEKEATIYDKAGGDVPFQARPSDPGTWGDLHERSLMGDVNGPSFGEYPRGLPLTPREAMFFVRACILSISEWSPQTTVTLRTVEGSDETLPLLHFLSRVGFVLTAPTPPYLLPRIEVPDGVASLLLAHPHGRALLNQQDDNGNTVLHHAVRNKDVKMVKVVLHFGASVHMANRRKEIPMDLAESGEIRALLRGKQEELQQHEAGLAEEKKKKELVTIQSKDVVLGNAVGAGQFSVVYKATWQGTDVAVKQLKMRDGSDTAVIKAEFENEVSVCRLLGTHPRVVPFIGACAEESERQFLLVMNFMTFGSVEDYLLPTDNKTVPRARYPLPLSLSALPARVCLQNLRTTVQLLTDASAGILQCHSKNVLHRDIAARNVLVDKFYRGYVSDFGLSVVLPPGQSIHTHSVTQSLPLVWCAPETIVARESSRASDCYMFALFMNELLARQTPYQRCQATASLEELVPAILAPIAPLRPVIPEWCPRELAELMQGAWVHDPAKRLTMYQLNARLNDYLEICLRAKKLEDVYTPVGGRAQHTQPLLSLAEEMALAASQERYKSSGYMNVYQPLDTGAAAATPTAFHVHTAACTPLPFGLEGGWEGSELYEGAAMAGGNDASTSNATVASTAATQNEGLVAWCRALETRLAETEARHAAFQSEVQRQLAEFGRQLASVQHHTQN